MTRREWFGFRTVTRPRRRGGLVIWHAFRNGRPYERSLCGRAKFGPAIRYPTGRGRPCRVCAAAWHRRYPKSTGVVARSPRDG
jgi:hypothetical protein